MAPRRSRSLQGLLPRVGGGLWHLGRWVLHHPQPLIASALLGASLWALGIGLRHSQAFRLLEVRLPPNSNLVVPDSLISQNLWAADLRALAVQLHAQQPHLKRVRVIRLLPSTLQVEVLERTPVAQVRHGQWYAVDGEGFILPQAHPRAWEALVILQGIETPRAPLNVGRANPSDRLLLALRVLKALRRSSALMGHRLIAIDVADSHQLTLTVDDDIEIRCGNERQLPDDLARLRTVFKLLASQRLPIEYIDLRFQEPVIGPRT